MELMRNAMPPPSFPPTTTYMRTAGMKSPMYPGGPDQGYQGSAPKASPVSRALHYIRMSVPEDSAEDRVPLDMLPYFKLLNEKAQRNLMQQLIEKLQRTSITPRDTLMSTPRMNPFGGYEDLGGGNSHRTATGGGGEFLSSPRWKQQFGDVDPEGFDPNLFDRVELETPSALNDTAYQAALLTSRVVSQPGNSHQVLSMLNRDAYEHVVRSDRSQQACHSSLDFAISASSPPSLINDLDMHASLAAANAAAAAVMGGGHPQSPLSDHAQSNIKYFDDMGFHAGSGSMVSLSPTDRRQGFGFPSDDQPLYSSGDERQFHSPRSDFPGGHTPSPPPEFHQQGLHRMSPPSGF